MKKKVSKQQRNYKRARKKREQQWREEYEKNRDQRDYDDCKELIKAGTFAEAHGDLGKLLYSYSDARTWLDLPRGQKFRKTFVPQRIFLFAFAILLCAWFITALIYQLCTTVNVGKTLLHLLPSFILIAACTAILLVSVFGGWGEFVRWGFKHNLIRGRGAIERARLRQLKLELEIADMRKSRENRIDITPDYVVLSVYGKEEIFNREQVEAHVYKHTEGLQLILKIDGDVKEFPVLLSEEEYVPLKAALRDQLTAMRMDVTDKSELLKKFVREIPATIMALLILAAGIMLVVTHYLWVKEIPPFLGVFFIGGGFLALGNTYSFIPAVNAAGIPFVFSLILLIVPPWALVWFNQYIFHSSGNVLQIILRCDALTAGFSFFTVIGAYVFTFAMTKIIDYIRFGEIK
ncbi:MAG: hypothetical protein K2J54_00340 [Clostridia bacterium]|nr:hypothetical protein [Clostridia bacterium]